MTNPSNPLQPAPKTQKSGGAEHAGASPDSSEEQHEPVSEETAEKALNKIEEVRRKLEPRG